MRPLRSYAGSRLARPLFWLAAAFALVMATLPHPPDLPGEPSDKVQHAVAFVTLSLLGAAAFPRLRLVRLWLLLSLFGAAIEIIQMIPMLHRDSEVLDWVTDTAAAGIALLLAFAGRARAGR